MVIVWVIDVVFVFVLLMSECSSSMWLVRYRVFLMLWVIRSTVVCLVVWMLSRRFCIWSWVSVLRVLNGLLSSNILGLCVRVWVSEVCCVILLDILCGCWFVVWLSLIRCSSLCMCFCLVLW